MRALWSTTEATWANEGNVCWGCTTLGAVGVGFGLVTRWAARESRVTAPPFLDDIVRVCDKPTPEN